MEYKTITPDIIRSNLQNLSQVVFEVTSACNFRCEYCTYGNLYKQGGSQSYVNKSLAFSDAKILIDYLAAKWSKHMPQTPNQEVYISFFGGEPLLNMKLISKIISYIEGLPNTNRRFVFSMTTNGWLLDKYQDYLVEKDVHLLISLDGDKFGNSYRVSTNKKQTHSKVENNIARLLKKNPDYFKKRVSFNSVLHDRNSVSDVAKYIYETFGKIPHFSPLASSNVNSKHLDEFNKIKKINYKIESLEDDIKSELFKEQFSNIPIIRDIIRDYFIESGNVFRSYNELIFGQDLLHFQTGTCTPFSKKIYIRSNGEILACERIPDKFCLGKIIEGKVFVDEENIANKYQSWLGLLGDFCGKCARSKTCNQCIFQIDGFPDKIECDGYISSKEYDELRQRYFAILGRHPEIYKQIYDNVILM